MPVDSTIEVSEPLTSAGSVVPLLLGRSAQPAADGTVAASSHDSALLGGMPAATPPAAGFWLEQRRGGGAAAFLSEADKRCLRSLGYVAN